MRVRFSMFLVVLFAVTDGCAPKEKCGGVHYYDPDTVSCRPCPKTATFKDGTCECKDPLYTFANNKCVLMDGAVPEEPEDSGPPPDSGMTTGSTPNCGSYCEFAKVCIGDNTLAQAALSDIVKGLHADDPAACKSSCESDLGGDGSGDPVIACIDAGQEAAACAGNSTQAGLAGGITLLGDCCRPHMTNGLCKSICKTMKANALISSMVDFCP
jgi:hypothetical protein